MMTLIAVTALGSMALAQTGCMPQPSSPDAGAPNTLSERLAQSHGVITPPATGDLSVVVAPRSADDERAVIPPPGTGGGDTTTERK
jgi:hypothetical protein